MSETISPKDLLNTITMEKYRKDAEHLKKKKFSDVFDAEGNQYVDLVQEGGGVLGFALLGYTYILENAGLRFFNLAGTSAGSINALLIASLGKIGDKKSEKIIEYLCNQNLFDFVDGDKRIKKLIQRLIDKKGRGWFFNIIFRTPLIYRKLVRNKGFNPGVVIENWLSKILNENGVYTLEDIHRLLEDPPSLFKEKSKLNITKAQLALITSEITTMTKVEFPNMAELYWENPQKINPSKMVRASMSIPFFFEPFTINNIPQAGKKEVDSWKSLAGYGGPVPNKVDFVDGGMLSNFPINAFHNTNKIPNKPTFGVRLASYREEYANTDSLSGFMGSMIKTMRHVHDLDFLLRHPDYKHLICRIDADQQFNWLNFNLDKKDKVALFQLGAEKGLEFLHKFNWDKYKETRKKLMNATQPSKPKLTSND